MANELIVDIPSTTSERVYRLDIIGRRCSCPAWKFQKGGRKECKHLKLYGYGLGDMLKPDPRLTIGDLLPAYSV